MRRPAEFHEIGIYTSNSDRLRGRLLGELPDDRGEEGLELGGLLAKPAADQHVVATAPVAVHRQDADQQVERGGRATLFVLDLLHHLADRERRRPTGGPQLV